MVPDALQKIPAGPPYPDIPAEPGLVPPRIQQPPDPFNTVPQPQLLTPGVPLANPTPIQADPTAFTPSVRNRTQSAPPILRKTSTKEVQAAQEPGLTALPVLSPHAGTPGPSRPREKKSEPKGSQGKEKKRKKRNMTFVRYIVSLSDYS